MACVSLADARDRIQFGKPIASYQAVAHKLVDMQIMTDAARGLLYRSTSLLDHDEDCSSASAIAKIFATENNVRCADIGIQVMGGAGYSIVAWHLIVRMRRINPRLAFNCENLGRRILRLSASVMKLSTHEFELSCARRRH